MKRFLKRLRARFPERLPQGRQEFERWSDDILDLYNLPNNTSTKFALAVSILHAPATDAYKPKFYYGRLMMKGAANEVAGAVMQELKTKQAEATALAQKAEASNEQLQSQTVN